MENFLLIWIIVHTFVLSIGFAIGLAVGLNVPVIGDAIAMLLVGGLLMFSQYYLLSNHLGVTHKWIIFSFVGLILGVGISFIFILKFDDTIGLAETHVWGFPMALVILTFFQAMVFKDEKINGLDNFYLWPIISLTAFVISSFILYLVNSQYNLAFDLLGDRRKEFDKVPRWGLIGLIIGVVYGILTGFVLNRSGLNV